jgi:NAD-dependent deacetylase
MKEHIVVFTGAGMSAESGIKTFRDADGLWNNHKIEDVATFEAFEKNQQLVQDFYNLRRRELMQVEPNAAHYLLAKLEEKYKVTIVTQNIDDLHERAGSTNVLHLHGELRKMHTVNDRLTLYEIDGDIVPFTKGPDGSYCRPHVVWFGEEVPMLEIAAEVMCTADIFILIGSSLQVYPAAGLIEVVEDEVRKYVIDKNIPPLHYYNNIIPLEMTATEGMRKLMEILY